MSVKMSRVQSASPIKRTNHPLLRSSGSQGESLSSTAELTVRIYDIELGEVRSRIEQNTPGKVMTDVVKSMLSLNDKHFRRTVDFKAMRQKHQYRSSRHPEHSSANVSTWNSPHSTQRISSARTKTNHSNSPVKLTLSVLQSPNVSNLSSSINDFKSTSTRPFTSSARPFTSSNSPKIKVSLQRKTDRRLLKLQVISNACDTITALKQKDASFIKGLKTLRSLRKSLDWTSQTLDKIEAGGTDLWISQYNYLRSDRANQEEDQTNVCREFKETNCDPNRPIARIERTMRWSRARTD